jgi:hypothetical protein
MRVLKLTEQQFFSIMLELLRMEGKREDGIERIEGKKWKGKMKGKGRRVREGGRIVSESYYVPLN